MNFLRKSKFPKQHEFRGNEILTNMNNSQKHTVLLTGSVKQNYTWLEPQGLWRSEERLFEYLCAIGSWLQQPEIEAVVYIDASGFKIQESLFDSPKLETFAIDLTEVVYSRGKGPAETESLLYAMRESRFLGRNFWKCTGRLFVRNFTDILKEIEPLEPKCYMRVIHEERWSDTRFFYINRDQFETVIQPHVKEMFDYEHRISEYLYFKYLKDYRELPTPIFIGRSGQTGKLYDSNYPQEIQEIAQRQFAQIDPQTIPPTFFPLNGYNTHLPK